VRTQILAQRLTDKIVKALLAPSKGSKIHYDTEVKGFGCRITANGARSFVLNYRTRAGRERRYTIGGCTDWTTSVARDEASRLKQEIRGGRDPVAELKALIEAPTVSDLCDTFETEYLPKKASKTRIDYETRLRRYIRPTLGHLILSEVKNSNIKALHRDMTKAGNPVQANRTVTLLATIFNFAVDEEWLNKNPIKKIKRNAEQERSRYLNTDEISRLAEALDGHDDIQAANIIRLLLLTGARRGEVQGMKWENVDLKQGVWTKPGSTVKQRTEHRVPLSDAAVGLLKHLQSETGPDDVYVFPGTGKTGHRLELKKDWAALCKAADISNARIHDLRHTYASVLASAGMSLPVIGALLGHAHAQTTQRYAHLFDDPLRQATEHAAAIVTGKQGAEIVFLPKTRHGV